MAFDSFTEFYVTKHVSAAITNGGSGVGDGIDLADVDAFHDGAGVHTLTDQGADGFAGTNVGDFICWDTAGAAEYARVTAVTSDDIIVVQNMVGAVQFTALTEKAVTVGGAWATVDHAAATITTSFVDSNGYPPRVNIAYDAADYDEEVEFLNAGTVAIPLTFEGYYATAGDECMNGTTFTPPTIDGGAGAGQAGTLLANAPVDYVRIRNLKVLAETNNADCINTTTVDHSLFDRLWLKATGTTADGIHCTGISNEYKNIFIESVTSYGIFSTLYDLYMGVYIRKANIGLSVGSYSTVLNCIVEDTANDSVRISGTGIRVVNSVFYDSAYHGIYAAGMAKNGLSVINCIFDTIVGDAIKGGGVMFVTEVHNSFRACGGVRHANILSDPVGNTTHAADPFTNAGAHDFSLNNNTPGGAQLRSQGFPGTMLDGTNIGYRDIGALQVEAAAGGAALSRVRLGM